MSFQRKGVGELRPPPQRSPILAEHEPLTKESVRQRAVDLLLSRHRQEFELLIAEEEERKKSLQDEEEEERLLSETMKDVYAVSTAQTQQISSSCNTNHSQVAPADSGKPNSSLPSKESLTDRWLFVDIFLSGSSTQNCGLKPETRIRLEKTNAYTE